VLGIPDLWMAQDSVDLYYVKIWKKRGGDHVEMQALWNREVRALSRLQGYPGAAQLFVRKQDTSAAIENSLELLLIVVEVLEPDKQ
ncbi:hypothetical protein ACC676_39005, partial [Rhizobium ruizarguesonis]